MYETYNGTGRKGYTRRLAALPYFRFTFKKCNWKDK